MCAVKERHFGSRQTNLHRIKRISNSPSKEAKANKGNIKPREYKASREYV
jgi:hypothetical protein